MTFCLLSSLMLLNGNIAVHFFQLSLFFTFELFKEMYPSRSSTAFLSLILSKLHFKTMLQWGWAEMMSHYAYYFDKERGIWNTKWNGHTIYGRLAWFQLTIRLLRAKQRNPILLNKYVSTAWWNFIHSLHGNKNTMVSL